MQAPLRTRVTPPGVSDEKSYTEPRSSLTRPKRRKNGFPRLGHLFLLASQPSNGHRSPLMPDKDKSAVATVPAPAVVPPTPGTPPVPPRRSPGHRGADVKDTVAEMAGKAHEISLEAGSKMAAAMKDVVGAAAGLTGLVVESARDLLQYMVRRGQMTQDEADKL